MYERQVSALRPLFFYFLVYGFLGRKNGSVGREKKKKKSSKYIMSGFRKKSYMEMVIKKVLGNNIILVECTPVVIKVVTQNYCQDIILKIKEIPYLEEFSSKCCVIKLK